MRVIDLTNHVAGPFATLLLAELGADVIKVEQPGQGDPWRRYSGAMADDSSFEYLNRRKRSITLNLRTRRGRGLLLDLAATADAVVENFSPGGLARLRLSFRSLRKANPDIVLTSISNFGQEGPRRNWQATELVLEAMGGVVWGTGWDDASPLKLPGYQACYVAGLNAAIATQAAVLDCEKGDAQGVHIDLSIQEALTLHWTRQVTRYVYDGRPYRRERRGPGRQGFPHTVMARDGYVYMLAMRAEWEAFAFFLGLEQFVTHEWSDAANRAERWQEIEPYFLEAVSRRSKNEWFEDAAVQGFTFAPIDDPNDLLSSPQLAARGFFQTAVLSTGESVSCPGLPFKPPSPPTMPNCVPRVGEDNDEVYRGLLGLKEEELENLARAGVI